MVGVGDGIAGGFGGFTRADGGVGIRNRVLVLGVNGLAARVAERIAAALPGVVCVASRDGRGQIEPDIASHRAQMLGLALNPNVGGVLIVGVDEEATEGYRDAIARAGRPVDAVSFAETGEDAFAVMDLGCRRLATLARAASAARRGPVQLSALTVGVECGHSDATSGIAGNRVIGALVDRLVDMGATVLVGETVEWLGAEHLLAARARTPGTGAAIVGAVAARQAMVAASGASLTGNNPGEENIRGGLSTIEEKALGAVAKAGSRPIEGLVGLTERPGRPGLWLMDGPSFSPVSMTAFAAVGAQLMVFSTGPGNSYASAIAPTIKLTANAGTAARLPEQIDFDASPVFSGTETAEAAAGRLLGLAGEIAGGTLTWGEALGEGLEVPTRLRGAL
ncbi:altronate dehydratase large subunit [Amaricoccus macauensis]|uniref:Altronate dehydratase large subunit n=1 Tax=Amaricoccus macauensis TaxID=57001 RepID=A0A840SPD7_9RHOB|nr:UxaA family hydrolase [Amaricoccus macauensis]MBB5221263.1 altronate dehydratase large subunit [Amaricoccus macauensis]